MNLSKNKILKDLIQQEKNWHRCKWPLTILSLFSIVLSFCCVIRMFFCPAYENEIPALIKYSIPYLLFFLLIAFIVLGIIVRDWNGNSNRLLFIKIMEDLEELKKK